MKTYFKIAFVFLSLMGYAQKENTKTEEFFELIECENIVTNVFSAIELSIKEQTKTIFENYGLDFNKKEDVEIFDEFLSNEIQAFSSQTYYNLLDIYSTKYSTSDIEKFIKLQKNKNYKGSVLEDSKLKAELSKLVTDYENILYEDIILVLERIKAKSKPLTISVFIDKKPVQDKNISLDLILTLFEGNSFSIFDKNNYELSLPENFDYDKIKSLTIIYNNKEYVIERYNKSFPREIQDLTSPLSIKSFTEHSSWILKIDTDKMILENNITTEIHL